MSIRDQLAQAVAVPLAAVAERDGLAIDVDPASVHLERPARRDHGDWSTNIALVTAKRAGSQAPGRWPRRWSRCSRRPPAHLESVEVAGPGFVNFRLADGWLHDALTEVVAEGEQDYARTDIGHGERVQVEFISANPTGPLHVGNGWWGGYGDALARVLARCGWQVQPRVLRQRHRRADPDAWARACWPAVAARRCPRAATRAST